jgi:hypothetical protein
VRSRCVQSAFRGPRSEEKADFPSAFQDRLTNPIEQDITSLSSLLTRHLDRKSGEVILHFSSSTLSSTALASICDSPATATPLAFDTVVLPQSQVNAILATCKSAAEQSVVVTLLHNPFDADGMLKKDEGVKLTETTSAVNDEETQQRWRSQAVRVLVRRKPDGAEQLLETRVAVVGNVVRIAPLYAL